MSSIHRDRVRKRQRFAKASQQFNHPGYYGYCLKNAGKWWRLSRMEQLTKAERQLAFRPYYNHEHRRKAARASWGWVGKWAIMGGPND